MYLRELHLNNFRSCADTVIRFDETLTILAGENNAGKTNVLDALRLMTAPSDGRRLRVFERDDVRLGTTALRLSAEYVALDPAQRGLFFTALEANSSDRAKYALSWSPPSGKTRRRTPNWTVGPADGAEIEPEVRDLIRHVHLPALRDAERDLASSGPGRIEFLLRHLLAGNQHQEDALLSAAKSAFDTVLSTYPLGAAQTKVRDAFAPLTEGFAPHEAYLRFAAPSLLGLARDLRFLLASAGFDPDQLPGTGLGYSNLLYLASVLVELEAARDAELTLLLVEEPEAHLHPQLQRATLTFLETKAIASAKRDPQPGEHAGRIQVVVSTHSPNLTAATSIKHVVVLRASKEKAPDAGSGDAATGEHGSVDETEVVARPPATSVVMVHELNLLEAARRKIDRYLDVTRSALLFGRRVLLVEGIAEAILMPVFAKLALNESELGLFRAVTVIAIDGVDFEPYVRLLLGRSTGGSVTIADRVVIVTDEDHHAVQGSESADSTEEANGSNEPSEETSSDGAVPGVRRKQLLEGLAKELGCIERLLVEVTPDTFEASLVSGEATEQADARTRILGNAFHALKPSHRRANNWQKRIASLPTSDRGKALLGLLKSTGTLKGDFAQAVADEIRTEQSTSSVFPVPGHLVRALKALVAEVA